MNASTPVRILVASTSERHHVKVYSSLEAFGDWPSISALAEMGGYCFQGKEFLEVWLRTIGAARGTSPAFVQVTDDAGHPVMLLALGVERRHGLRRLVFLDGGVCDYNAPVLFEPAAAIAPAEMASIWSGMLRELPRFDLAVLKKTPGEVQGIPNPLAYLGAIPERDPGHIIALRGTWENYATTALPRRQDSRRKRRQLAEIGPVRLVIAGSPAEAERFLSVMIRQKTRRYLETFGRDDFKRPGYGAYFPAMIDRFLVSGVVQMAAVFVGDDIVATHWGIVAGRRFHYLMPAFEAGEWSRFSPGRLLIEELIAWSFASGIEVFDFGPGDEPFKTEFRSASIPTLRLERPVSALGRLHQGLTRGRKLVGASPLGPPLKRVRDWIKRPSPGS